MNGCSVSWLRRTWQTSWHRKHSMHLRYSWTRSTSSCCQRQSSWGTSVGRAERLDRLVDLVVPRHVGHEVADERERAHRLDGDRLRRGRSPTGASCRSGSAGRRPRRCTTRTWRPCSSSARRGPAPRGPGSSGGRRARPCRPRPGRRTRRSGPASPGLPRKTRRWASGMRSLRHQWLPPSSARSSAGIAGSGVVLAFIAPVLVAGDDACCACPSVRRRGPGSRGGCGRPGSPCGRGRCG